MLHAILFRRYIILYINQTARNLKSSAKASFQQISTSKGEKQQCHSMVPEHVFISLFVRSAIRVRKHLQKES